MKKEINRNFNNKVFLITGGTGSFGNAVLNKLLGLNVKEVRIFSRDEKKQEDMRLKYNQDKLKFYLGDVRDQQSVIKSSHGCDYIFHAAALKQVPSCEYHPMEAIKTNILGSSNVIDAAIKCSIKKLVMLSTDKAVYPINAMGQTKALMEKLMLSSATSLKKSNTILCATRYGNVMASRGSVIPLFIGQIKKNENITVTDPNMTRFLMSLEESVELVMQAFSQAKQGDIFVQKSPSVKIDTLAKTLIKLFNSKSKIKIIGTRHGEKEFETLISREEMTRTKVNKNFYRIVSDNRGLNYKKYVSQGKIKTSMTNEYNSHNTKILNSRELEKELLKLDFIKSQLDEK